LDESFFAVAPYLTRGWFPVGSKPVLKYEYKRTEKHCVMGALGQNDFLYMFSEENIESSVFECFLRLLLEKFGKILLVMDSAPYHVSWALWGFYLQNAGRMKIIQLPSYSPELNPAELVWRETKKWVGTKPWTDKHELKTEIKSAFREDFSLVGFYDYLLP